MLFPCSEERIVGLRCDGQPLSPITLNPFIPLKTKQTKKISSLTSFWSSPVMSVETLRLLTNWLVVSVLRLTGVLWSVPADGCPILGPAQLLCAAVMWLFLPGVVLTTWLSFYLKHKHARKYTLLDKKWTLIPNTLLHLSLHSLGGGGGGCLTQL